MSRLPTSRSRIVALGVTAFLVLSIPALFAPALGAVSDSSSDPAPSSRSSGALPTQTDGSLLGTTPTPTPTPTPTEHDMDHDGTDHEDGGYGYDPQTPEPSPTPTPADGGAGDLTPSVTPTPNGSTASTPTAINVTASPTPDSGPDTDDEGNESTVGEGTPTPGETSDPLAAMVKGLQTALGVLFDALTDIVGL